MAFSPSNNQPGTWTTPTVRYPMTSRESKNPHFSTNRNFPLIHWFWITFGLHKFIHILWKSCGKLFDFLCTRSFPHFIFPAFSTLFALWTMWIHLFTLSHTSSDNFLFYVNNQLIFPHLSKSFHWLIHIFKLL